MFYITDRLLFIRTMKLLNWLYDGCEFQQIVDKGCANVSIRFHRPGSDRQQRVTVPTSNTTLFRLAFTSIRARAFANVKQLVSNWPLAVKALDDHMPPPGEDDITTMSHVPLFYKAVIIALRVFVAMVQP